MLNYYKRFFKAPAALSSLLLCIIAGLFLPNAIYAKDEARGMSSANPQPKVLFIGGNDLKSYKSQLFIQLKDAASVSFVDLPGLDDVNALEKVLNGLDGQDWDLVLLGIDANEMPVLSSAGRELFASIKERAPSSLLVSGLPLKRDESAEVVARNKELNKEVFRLAIAEGLEIYDVYGYVDIRRTDLMDANAAGLSNSGKQLVGSVVAGRVLDLLDRANDDDLPSVVIMGDSIANGYHVPLKSMLANDAVVKLTGTAFGARPNWAAIVRRTQNELKEGRKPDLITFNWGLHALKYVDGNNRLATPDTGSRCIPLDRYKSELELFIEELKKTGAKLLWITTTPENNSPWALKGDAELYNKAAKEVVSKYGIDMIDLHDLVSKTPGLQLANDCHFTPQGYEVLAGTLAEAIRKQLAAKERSDP